MLSTYDMLKLDEGLRYKAYKDTKGNVTVGIGFNMDSSSARGVWIHASIPESFTSIYSGTIPLSTNSINSLLNTCVDWCRVDLESLFPNLDSYPDYVQLALINLMFNMGKPTFSQFNTFIKLIEGNNYDAASTDLSNTKWSEQLKQRSSRVCKLLKGDTSGYSTPIPNSSVSSS